MRIRTAPALLAALALAVAACGGDGATTPDARPDATTDADEDGADPGDDTSEDPDEGAADDAEEGVDEGIGNGRDDEGVAGELFPQVQQAWELLGQELPVVEANRVTWSDGSLGCPEPGMMYTQALTDGYRIVFEDLDGEPVYVHGEEGGAPFVCENPDEPAS